MERPNLYSPFPEIEKLKEIIPDTGIAFHGTTRENAEKILAEGFKINHPYRIKHLNYMHFFYIPPRGLGYSNTHSSKALMKRLVGHIYAAMSMNPLDCTSRQLSYFNPI